MPAATASKWMMLKEALADFSRDDAMTLAGALAFYAALSLSPLLIILLMIAGLSGETTRQQVVDQIETVVGPEAGRGVGMIVENAQARPSVGTAAGVIGIAVLLFSATGVFAQLKASMNRIWDVRIRSDAGVWAWIRTRLLAFVMVAVVAVLLVASLVATAALGMVFSEGGWVWRVVSFVLSLAVVVLLFAVMFKYLPDVKITWNSVWAGAILTGVLFTLGKFLIGLYLGYSSVGSAYGAAGSLIVLLVWVYYSSLTFFLGAELTQVYARHSGVHLEPNDAAEWRHDT